MKIKLPKWIVSITVTVMLCQAASAQSSQEYSDFLRRCEQAGGYDAGGPNNPNCVVSGSGSRGYSDYESAGARLGLWINQSVRQAFANASQRRDARNQRYNELVAQANSARDYGDITSFNRYANEAIQIVGGSQNREWIRSSNYYHYTRLGDGARSANNHNAAIQYYEGALGHSRGNERRELQRLINWHRAALLLANGNNTSLGKVERLAIYDRALRMDETVVAPEGRAYIEWFRGEAAMESGDTRSALRAYRAALRVPGNDTPEHRQTIATLEDTIQLNRGARSSGGREAAAGAGRSGAPESSRTARGQLGALATGTNTIGQGFDGGGAHDDGRSRAVIGQIDAPAGQRVFTEAEIERYSNADPAFREAHSQVTRARVERAEARSRRAALERRAEQTPSFATRSIIQTDISRALQAEQRAEGTVRIAENDLATIVRRIHGAPEFVD